MKTKRPPRTIHRQMLIFVTLICIAVFLPVGIFLSIHHITQTRSRLGQSLAATANIVASNAGAAVSFGNRGDATETLGSLKNDRLVLAAALYDKEGRRFVTYGGSTPAACPDAIPAGERDYEIIVPVRYGGDTLGRLLVLTDNRAELRRTLTAWAVVYFAAFVIVVLLAVMLAAGFRRAVAAPLVELARTAADVADRRDYSVRARVGGTAEVAELAATLNTMLEEVGKRDAELDRRLAELRHEVREREQAEADLRQNHRELLRLSHAAGMAEVATGVLHNIGNALNSINVSTEMLATKLHARARSSAAALRDFFREPPPKAAPVFAAHPDGADLQAFAGSVAGHIADQLAQADKEVVTLRTGVAHIKDIVARQQTLAKSARRQEVFDVREAVEESLLIDKTDARFPPGALVVEFAEAGPAPVYSDRTAVVQILINLLANARAAIESAAPPAPRLIVRIGAGAEALRTVSVIDNGVGIAREQLVSIFSYGFSTKQGGHGFGLHNAANNARLLGGSLAVISEGPGLGATFTLSLPVRPPADAPAHDA